MPDLLDPDRAAALARRLKVIKNYPWDEEANSAVAECLIRWCRGAFEGRRIWAPEDQAEWVVTELISRVADSGDEWEGIAQLRAVYRERFLPQPEQKPYELPPPISCSVCGDTGREPFERNGYEYSRPCTACKRKPPAAVACGDCAGKETKLVNGVRVPCKCLSPERRKEILEWLNQQREAS